MLSQHSKNYPTRLVNYHHDSSPFLSSDSPAGQRAAFMKRYSQEQAFKVSRCNRPTSDRLISGTAAHFASTELMKIKIIGAAGGEVTGSSVQTKHARVLVDYGIFQGRKRSEALNQPLTTPNRKLDAVLLTQGHLDPFRAVVLARKNGSRRAAR